MPHTRRTLTLLGLCLALAGPAVAPAEKTAGDPAPDPAAGMKVSGPMQVHAQLQQRFRHERAAAVAAALEGLRSTREDDVRVDGLTQLAIVALARRDEVKRIAEESALPDDRKLGQKLAAFYDAGYVGAEEGYDGSGNWASGAGLGLRYDTGFGPVRVDVATPVAGGPDDADAVQIYIGIGQAF